MKHLLSTDIVLCPQLFRQKRKIAQAQNHGILLKEFQENK